MHMSELRWYPQDWPRCPACGREVLDGHLTCGRAACGEAAQRAQLPPKPFTCLASLDDGRLCGARATTVDPQRMLMVCPAHAPQERNAQG
jgi:hypothetical protein